MFTTYDMHSFTSHNIHTIYTSNTHVLMCIVANYNERHSLVNNSYKQESVRFADDNSHPLVCEAVAVDSITYITHLESKITYSNN